MKYTCKYLLLFSCSVVSDSLQPYGLMHARLPCPSLSPGVCSNLCPLMSSDAIQPSHPLSPSSPPALNLSQHQGLFQWSLCIRWSKYWSFSFSISPSNEYSGLISFRIPVSIQSVKIQMREHLQIKWSTCINR